MALILGLSLGCADICREAGSVLRRFRHFTPLRWATIAVALMIVVSACARWFAEATGYKIIGVVALPPDALAAGSALISILSLRMGSMRRGNDSAAGMRAMRGRDGFDDRR
jgi:hypothetical protein